MSGEPKTHLPGASKRERRWLYRCERTADWGLGINGGLIAGLTLVPVPDEHQEEAGDDPLGHELGEGLLDAQIALPDEGLKEGAVYQAFADLWSSDWESSVPDSSLVRLVLVEEGVPVVARDEAAELRAALEDARERLRLILTAPEYGLGPEYIGSVALVGVDKADAVLRRLAGGESEK